MSNRLFLSCVTPEFEFKQGATPQDNGARFSKFRSKLSAHLRRADCDVKVQEDFRQDGELDTVEKLADYIRTCGAVVHILGSECGSVANATARAALLANNELLGGRPFLADLPKLQEQLGDCSDLTYTQWEAFLALHYKVQLFVYEISDAEGVNQIHLDRLRVARRYAEPFNDDWDLQGKILADLQKILPQIKPQQKFAPSKLLRHAPEKLFGREHYLDALDKAWENVDTINVYSLIAWGGWGKTALMAHWMQRLRQKGWPDVERYFDWSFYSQGTGESRQTSSDLFISKALEFFDDPEPAAGGPWDRGQRLARLIGQHRTLLVLDGTESLQYPPTDRSGQAGLLKDLGLQALLSGLAQHNPGLCVVTSRETLADLKMYHDSAAPENKVEKLGRDAAVSLLRHLQVVRTDEELTETWKELRGHALSLQLLGRYLVDAFPDRDIRHRPEISYDEADQERQGRSAFKVMEAYERWLAQGGDERQRELAILRLTGLFDRPIDEGCLKALRAEPAIPGLTDQIVGLRDRQWNSAIKRLESIDLISTSGEELYDSYSAETESLQALSDSKRLGTVGTTVLQFLDAHPLIREYFEVQLKDQHPDAFETGHSRLFDHLCESTEHRPDTLDGLQPLYQAVMHGCLAERQQEACRDAVYIKRILRGHEQWTVSTARDNLGAIGADLSAVAAFFDMPWTKLASNLNEPSQAWLLHEAAFNLRDLGRLTTAVEPMCASEDMSIAQQNWKEAANCASNLSEARLMLGQVSSAVSDARRAVTFAERSPAVWQNSIFTRTSNADSLHQFGEVDAATELFVAAEALQQKKQPQFRLLYSLQGLKYCDLLLAQAEQLAWRIFLGQPSGAVAPRITTATPEGRAAIKYALATCDKVERRASEALEIASRGSGSPLCISHNHLTIARVALTRAMLTTVPARPSALQIPDDLGPAVKGLRDARRICYLPSCLLTAAICQFLSGNASSSISLFDEACQIAGRGPMPLCTADILLTRARLWGLAKPDDEYPWSNSSPEQDLTEARRIIEETHYYRRLPELEDAEMAIHHPDQFMAHCEKVRKTEADRVANREEQLIEKEKQRMKTARKKMRKERQKKLDSLNKRKKS